MGMPAAVINTPIKIFSGSLKHDTSTNSPQATMNMIGTNMFTFIGRFISGLEMYMH